MEMVGGILTLFQIQQFFCIDLGVLFFHSPVAVADGDKRKAELIKVAQAVVGDIPAQHAISHFVIFVTGRLPIFRGHMAEGRQIAMVLFAHSLQLFQSLVHFRSFHSLHSS